MAVNQELFNIIKQIKFIYNINQADIANQLGVKATYLSDMINSRVPFSDSMRAKIYDVYSDYLQMSTTGNMLSTPDNCQLDTSTPYYNSISNNASGGPSDASNNAPGDASTTSPPDSAAASGCVVSRQDGEDASRTSVLLIPTKAQGGTLNDFTLQVTEYDCERMISPVQGADFALQVAGVSMAPEYPDGSRVFVKRIKDKSFIEWGKVFVLDTCNGAVLKVLTPSDKENCVRCVSLNPDPIYAPFDVNLEDVYGIYRVLLCMSMK